MDDAMNEFEREMAKDGVEKTDPTNRVETSNGPNEPTPGQLGARDNAVGDSQRNYLRDFLDDMNRVSPDHVFNWRRDGAQTEVVSRLKHGHYSSGDQIDLHHKSIREAHELIWTFLSDALAEGHRTVSIVHGKGAKSNQPAQLKSYVGQALQDHHDVIAFCTAPPEQGGAGATLVWLRKSEEEKEATRERIQSRLG